MNLLNATDLFDLSTQDKIKYFRLVEQLSIQAITNICEAVLADIICKYDIQRVVIRSSGFEDGILSRRLSVYIDFEYFPVLEPYNAADISPSISTYDLQCKISKELHAFFHIIPHSGIVINVPKLRNKLLKYRLDQQLINKDGEIPITKI